MVFKTTYRPCVYGEIDCGVVLRRKGIAERRLVTTVDEMFVHLGSHLYTYAEVLEYYEHINGTPVGIVTEVCHARP